nr:hypothetical protein [Prevotella sp.]
MEEYNEYRIVKGDTLEDVSRRLRVASSYLKEFHNNNAYFQRQIGDDNDISGMPVLLIPKNLQEIQQKEIPDSVMLSHDNSNICGDDVVVENRTRLVLKENELIHSLTKISYEVSKTIDGNSVLQKVIKKNEQCKQISSLYQKMAEALSFISEPLDELDVILKEDGSVDIVANQDEIFQKWQELKNTDNAKLVLNDEKIGKTIENATDEDYKDTVRVLNSTPLYHLLIPNIFGIKNINTESKVDTNIILNSNFFTSEQIKFSGTEVCNMQDDNKSFIIKRCFSPKNKDKEKFVSLYDSQMKSFFDCPADYSMKVEASYLFSYADLRLQKTEYQMTEQLNSSAVFTNNINITYNKTNEDE